MKVPRRVLVMLASLFASSSTFAQAPPKIDAELSKKATTDKKQSYHVVFTEIVESKQQKDWTGVYNADVEVFKDGKSIGKFKGSTLPNDKPKKTDPAYEYSVVISTGSLKRALKQERFFSWKRGVREEKDKDGNDRPCLRLETKVPTLNVGTAREVDKLASKLINGAVVGNFNYATSILIHSGDKEFWRGSAGCLTIRPADAGNFFMLFPVGTTGTLSINRGIHDEETKMSYDY